MVTPQDVPRVLNDAARLVGAGEIVVFGSASLALWLERAPISKDVDLWIHPEDKGEIVEALMGELSWYHDKHGAYVEVCGPATFEAPGSWRSRAKVLTMPDYEGVRIVVPHPHDVLVAKLPRLSPSDRDHVELILEEAIAGRLYSGPCYEKYNASLRSHSGVAYLISKFKELCLGNNYACVA